jgi:diguanylate cyclase (GGDEF)-like protein
VNTHQSAAKPGQLPQYREPRHSVASASMLSSTAAVLIASLLLVLFQFLFQRSALMEDMLVQAKLIADSSSAPLMFADARAARETLAVLAVSPSIGQAAIYDSKQVLLASWRVGSMPAIDRPSRFEQSQQFGLHLLEVVQPVQMDGQTIGHVVLRVQLQQFYHRLLIFIGFTLIVALASLAAAYVLLARTRRKVMSAEANLDYLAHTDPVTNLPNRHAFNAALAAALRRADDEGSETTLLLLDLDNFKSVNDTLGHHSGDLLLQSVAQKLSACLRSEDILCRIGGDEFAVILRSQATTSANSSADAIAGKLLAALALPARLERHELYVTASIGISAYPRDARDLHTLARNADSAMYEAKAAGKNGYAVFHAGMDAAAQRRMLLESGLRRALDRDELSVHYQPQASFATGRIIGMEALLRWRHPELGMIAPD